MCWMHAEPRTLFTADFNACVLASCNLILVYLINAGKEKTVFFVVCFFSLICIIVSQFYNCHLYTFDCAESGASSSSQTVTDGTGGAAAAPVAGVPGFPFSMPPPFPSAPWLPMPPPPPFSEYESAIAQSLGFTKTSRAGLNSKHAVYYSDCFTT